MLESPAKLLGHEARALLTRLERVKSFALHETMVPAAAVSVEAQAAIEAYLVSGRRKLFAEVQRYIQWIEGPVGRNATPAEMQRRFTFLRLRFNTALSQFDIFASALTQRSEYETGVWLAGLDTLAMDSLRLPGGYFTPPPLLCHLERGMGAAIRRARTRLPGGGDSPAAVIRVPRERMIGTGIGSSLLHECGHQGAALLGLVESLRREMLRLDHATADERLAWQLWYRWISEIVADVWSIATLGIGATLGLTAVVSLPSAFVFMRSDGVHPIPYVRVQLGCALGAALFPHAQWAALWKRWTELYPMPALAPRERRVFAVLTASMPRFVRFLLKHRPPSLRGRTIAEVLPVATRQPARLSALHRLWRLRPMLMRRARPTLVFAVFGQARADGPLQRPVSEQARKHATFFAGRELAVGASAQCAHRRIPKTQGASQWQMDSQRASSGTRFRQSKSSWSARRRSRPTINLSGS